MGYTSTRMYGVTWQHGKGHKNIKLATRQDVSNFFCEQNKQGDSQQLFMLACSANGTVYIVQDERKFPLLSEAGNMSEWKSQ